MTFDEQSLLINLAGEHIRRFSFTLSTLSDAFLVQLGRLRVFLHIYIRTFILVSDIDGTVEEKLLIGD